MTISQLVGAECIVCPTCHSLLAERDNGIYECASCKFVAHTRDGVLITGDQDETGSGSGFMAHTFESPRTYEFMIRLKWKVLGLLRVRDQMIGISDRVVGQRVLEIGCGPTLKLPSSEFRPQDCSQYVGLDFSTEFVLAARRENPEPNLDFVQGDAGSLPFSDNYFDLTVAAFTIHHVPHNPSIVVAEMARVSKQSIVIFDHVKSSSRFWSSIQSTYWRLADGGHHYLTRSEWSTVLAGRPVEVELRTGAIGRHVIKFVVRS
jgi:SAM-dependent methyltransferase